MLFSSIFFLWLFLPLVLIGCWLLKPGVRNLFLLLASIIFYAWGEPQKVILMLVSILINYLSGLLVARGRGEMRRWVLIVNILINLGILGYFKYLTPSLATLTRILDWDVTVPEVLLPLGISFYTFQAISYVIDLYRGTIKVQKNLLDLGLYITFFPQLIAGPIVKYHDIELQLENRVMTIGDTAYGIKRFVYGLAKKVLIANQLAMIADDIFLIPVANVDMPTAWLGGAAFALQVYYDFSGYSDMAIGLGRMFGFRFMENFNYPYLSRSCSEFWRRWHISLSTWFKEYLYIPLGGSRVANWRACLNIMIVFTVTGIWHGAALNFVLWGAYFGMFIVLERVWLRQYLERPGWGWRSCAHGYFILMISFCWPLFCCASVPDAAVYTLKMISGEWNAAIAWHELITPFGIGLMLVGVALCGVVQTLFPKLREALYREDKIAWYELPVIGMLLVLSLFMLSGDSYNPFIYFRF